MNVFEDVSYVRSSGIRSAIGSEQKTSAVVTGADLVFISAAIAEKPFSESRGFSIAIVAMS